MGNPGITSHWEMLNREPRNLEPEIMPGDELVVSIRLQVTVLQPLAAIADCGSDNGHRFRLPWPWGRERERGRYSACERAPVIGRGGEDPRRHAR